MRTYALYRVFMMQCCDSSFFFNYTTTTDIYTLSLHDALPICHFTSNGGTREDLALARFNSNGTPDRKSTRLNSSHSSTSYAVFCFKKKNRVISNEYCTLQNNRQSRNPSGICQLNQQPARKRLQ